MWNLVLVYLETVLMLVQDRCNVCAKCTIGLENHFGHNDGSPTRLSLTQDRCTVCAKHTIGSEIILDAPDGTPR